MILVSLLFLLPLVLGVGEAEHCRDSEEAEMLSSSSGCANLAIASRFLFKACSSTVISNIFLPGSIAIVSSGSSS